MTLGQRIKAARKKAGLTQLQVGQRMGANSYQAVASWEKGLRNPKYDTLKRLAEAIGCPLSELTHDLGDGVRNEHQLKEVVELERLAWKARVYEKIRMCDFDSARTKLAVLQGVEFLAEALDLMEGNMNGRFALADLITDAEAHYILNQEGGKDNAGL